MLADEVASAFFTVAVIFCEIVTSFLAWLALSTAEEGNRSLAVILTAAAAILVVSITLYCGYAYLINFSTVSLFELILPWIIFAGLPFIMCARVILDLWRN
jgi:uncharacterized membrane protein YgdD (TMEM256/DUF423 family)